MELAVLTGSSVHNKGLNVCGVIHTDVFSLYYQLFSYLEDVGDLDVDSEVDLFCLHFVYQPKL